MYTRGSQDKVLVLAIGRGNLVLWKGVGGG